MKDEDQQKVNLDLQADQEPEESSNLEEVVLEDLGPGGEELPDSEKIKKNRLSLEERWKTRIAKLEKERDEYLAGWQRALADYQNLSRRLVEEKKDWGALAVRDFIEELFPVLDAYEAARNNKEAWGSVGKDWRTGIEYIFDLLQAKISERSVERFGAVGDLYEANFYEALENLETEDETKNQRVAQIIASGYKYKDHLLRPAKVKVFLSKK